MSKWLIDSDTLTDIANAVRAKRGTSGPIRVSDLASEIMLISGGRPVVPKTGTWQFKTTPAKGYIILGKDDDCRDEAQFVRMVNGYGWPVVLNTEHQFQDNRMDSDADSEYSLYPSDTVSHFPDGCSTNELNRYIVQNPALGEVALHGTAVDQLWDSDLLVGDLLNSYYETYVAGGGTKTISEMKASLMDDYAANDLAQGATVINANRLDLESKLDAYVYTIGRWGGTLTFKVDGITVGDTQDFNITSSLAACSREQDFMGNGLLTWNTAHKVQDPYWIYRNSSGLQPDNIGAMCQRAFDYKCCIDIFHHYYLDGSKARWDDFKESLDILKTYVDNGIVEVVTRKQYYELGEFVEHPITGVGLITDELSYPTGTVLTDSNFTCSYTLDNGDTGICESDRILDYSTVDTTTEGTYMATLEYRGKKTTCSVVIANSQPTHYLLENASFEGTTMVRQTNYCVFDEPITYEAGKSYRVQFHFKANTDTSYSEHYVKFVPALYNDTYKGWYTSDGVKLTTTQGVTEGDVSFDLVCVKTEAIGKLFYTDLKNTTITDGWWVTAAYVYEIEAE